MPTFHDVQQNTEEWLALRVGLVTGSGLSKVMANYGKAFGEPAKRYAVDIALEQLTGTPSSGGYSNDHMDRGHEQEPLARAEYEKQTFCEVLNGGFFQEGKQGSSPDGLVGKNGLIEIKSVIPWVQYETLRKGGFDSKYKWQLAGNLLVCGKEWIDYVSYCHAFPEGKKIHVYRIYAESLKDEFQQINSRVDEFFGLVEASKKIISEAA